MNKIQQILSGEGLVSFNDKDSGTPWSKKEVSFLKQNYKSVSTQTIADILHRTISSVRSKAQELRILKKKIPNRKKWTTNEERFLKNNYSNMSVKNIAKKLNRTPKSLKIKASNLGLSKDGRAYGRWTKEEITLLKKEYGRIPCSDIANMLDRTESAIMTKANKLGIHSDYTSKKRKKVEFPKKYRRWNNSDEKFLIEKYGRSSTEKLAKILDRTPSAIVARAKKLEIHSCDSVNYWTDKEEQYLKENYHKLKAREIAEKLNRTTGAIRSKAFKMGLSNSDYPSPTLKPKKIKDIPFNSDFAYVLGLVEGDGHIGRDSVTFSSSDYELNRKFNEIFSRLTGLRPHKKITYNMTDSIFYSTKLVDFMKNIDLSSLKKHNDETKGSFLRGFFDAEGYVECDKQREVSICNTNKFLLMLCDSLLNSLNIKTREVYTSHRKGRKTLYHLSLRNHKDNFIRFRKLVGFYLQRKARKLDVVISSYIQKSSTPMKWTQKDKDFLQNNHLFYTDTEIATILGRTPPAVETKRRQME